MKICARSLLIATPGLLVPALLLLTLLTRQPRRDIQPVTSRWEVKERLGNQKPFELVRTSLDRWIELQLLQTVHGIFKHYNVTYMIYGDTLLSSHRHMGLAPWDENIEVLVNVTCRQQLPDMLKHLASSLSLVSIDGTEKVYHSLSRRSCQQCPLKWPYLDISYFEENRTHIWDNAVTYGLRYAYPKFLTLPTHPRPLDHLWLPAPKDTLAFLRTTYEMAATCVASPWGYGHKLDITAKSYQRPCRDLRDRVAFVHRRPCRAAAEGSPDDACVMERLQLGSRVLRVATVAEPSFAINEPFSLRLVDSFIKTIPKSFDRSNGLSEK